MLATETRSSGSTWNAFQVIFRGRTSRQDLFYNRLKCRKIAQQYPRKHLTSNAYGSHLLLS